MGIVIPDYTGSGLVNLIAEIEWRESGTASSPRLADGSLLPPGDSHVLVIFDGLGAHQLAHPALESLRESVASTLTAGFPTTTTTSLATVVTGLPPSRHGVVGHLVHLPDLGRVVNMLKWITPEGRPVPYDYPSVLPSPNLWERLSAAGVEPITVQPGPFAGSPLSRMLYRGARFEPAWTTVELVTATLQMAGSGRFLLVYYPDVDVAAHVEGQESEAYAGALAEAARIWEQLSQRLPPEVVLVGTADHGHVDYRPEDKLLVRDGRYDRLRFHGDARSTYVDGPPDLIDDLVAEAGAEAHRPEAFAGWLGPAPRHRGLGRRLPDRLLLAPRGRLLLPRSFDKRLVGYHGGLEPEEVEIPLLVRS